MQFTSAEVDIEMLRMIHHYYFKIRYTKNFTGDFKKRKGEKGESR